MDRVKLAEITQGDLYVRKVGKRIQVWIFKEGVDGEPRWVPWLDQTFRFEWMLRRKFKHLLQSDQDYGVWR